MFYVRTSNDDRNTPVRDVMWTLIADVPTTVYVNFRSVSHACCAARWLEKGGWDIRDMEGTVSTGIPSGIYYGPVFSKDFEEGEIALRGSNCWEGTYFVFVEIRGQQSSSVTCPWEVVTI